MDIEQIRRIAGLPAVLAEAKKKKVVPVDDNMDDNLDVPAPAKGKKAAKKDSDDEDELPAIVTKLAKKAEGKEGDDMVALLKQVYDAGCKDGEARAAAKDE